MMRRVFVKTPFTYRTRAARRPAAAAAPRSASLESCLNAAYSRALCLKPGVRSLTLSLRAHQCPAHSQLAPYSLLHSVEDEAAVERRALNGFAPPSPVSSSSQRL
ncbi:hypothetical protein Q8A67_023423 [Cirrhinus molitorella]|uniref:Uncharacterized protein n=1 Tax=Cirrhinus molitorella TaxID=172907 RepID=A0AA88NZW4_9TELE|nr:hypothetical protein Q8A67_023423 [Cirrhinus molitorella]